MFKMIVYHSKIEGTNNLKVLMLEIVPIIYHNKTKGTNNLVTAIWLFFSTYIIVKLKVITTSRS